MNLNKKFKISQFFLEKFQSEFFVGTFSGENRGGKSRMQIRLTPSPFVVTTSQNTCFNRLHFPTEIPPLEHALIPRGELPTETAFNRGQTSQKNIPVRTQVRKKKSRVDFQNSRSTNRELLKITSMLFF